MSPRKAATATKPDVWPRLIADYMLEKRAAGASPRTTNHYREVLEDVLLPFCAAKGVVGPRDLTTRHLNELGAGRLDGSCSRSGRAISKATVHSYMCAINTFLVWARQQGEGGDVRGLLPSMCKRALDTLSRDEIQAPEDSASTERDKLLIRVPADTGMRLGELLTLRASDIRSEGGRHVIKVLGKGDRERLIPIQPALVRRLRRFADRPRQDSTSDRLFLTLRRGRETGQLGPLRSPRWSR